MLGTIHDLASTSMIDQSISTCHPSSNIGVCIRSYVKCNSDKSGHVQAYEQRRQKKDADREAAEAMQEAELARAAAARAAKQEAEAADWMGQISVEEQGQEAEEQQEGQVRRFLSSECSNDHLLKWAADSIFQPASLTSGL